MTSTAAPTDGSAIGRREAIRRAALLAGIVLSPEWLAVVEEARPLAQQSSLTSAKAAIVRTIP